MRKSLDPSKDEKNHALALHKESIILDNSTVSVIDYVSENLAG
jgi:hypothetical protein